MSYVCIVLYYACNAKCDEGRACISAARTPYNFAYNMII